MTVGFDSSASSPGDSLFYFPVGIVLLFFIYIDLNLGDGLHGGLVLSPHFPQNFGMSSVDMWPRTNHMKAFTMQHFHNAAPLPVTNTHPTIWKRRSNLIKKEISGKKKV